MDENNVALVVMLKNIQPIPGADKIVQAEIHYNGIKQTQVIVDTTKTNDQLMVYFDSNIALNQKLVDDYPVIGNYLGKKNRVRAIKLKGVISNGLALEVEKFFPYFKNEEEAKKILKDGYSFNKIGSQEICSRYIVPINNHVSLGSGSKKNKGKISSRMIPGLFNFHIDTAHLLKNIHKIEPNDVISISNKWHGTSSIVSRCMVKKNLTFIEKILKKVGVKVVDTEYDYIFASRRVVKNGAFSGSLHFYKEDIWTDVGKKYFDGNLHKGETVYFEIVGFTQSGGYIQKPFDYGCISPNNDIRVYRITMTNEDGIVSEYGWAAMKERCAEIGVKPVKEFYFGKAKDLFPELSLEEHWKANFADKLKQTYLEKDSEDCKNLVPDEGIVLRKESLNIEVYKLKSEKFIAFESEQAEKTEEVNIEDQVEEVNDD